MRIVKIIPYCNFRILRLTRFQPCKTVEYVTLIHVHRMRQSIEEWACEVCVLSIVCYYLSKHTFDRNGCLYRMQMLCLMQVAVPSPGAHLKENEQQTVFVRSAFISVCQNCVIASR